MRDKEPSIEPVDPEMTALEAFRLDTRIAFEHMKHLGKRGLQVGALAIATGVAIYPLAKMQAEQDASVQADLLGAPAEFSLTGNGKSTLQLGALGSYYNPTNRDGIGVSAEIKDLPSVGKGGVQEYFSPRFLNIITNFAHNPKAVVEAHTDLLTEEVKHKFITYESGGIVAIDALLIGGLLIMRKDWKEEMRNRPRLSVAVCAGVYATMLATGHIGADVMQDQWEEASPTPVNSYPISALDGTTFEGTVASNAALQLATSQAAPMVEKMVVRQEQATDEFIAKATASLESQVSLMEGPREGETAYMAMADPHGIEAMLVMDKLFIDRFNERFPSQRLQFVTIAGDLTTNSTVAERTFIQQERDIGSGTDTTTMADNTPVVAIAGDHESPISAKQMEEVGMVVPNLETKEVRGVTFLGANDTAQKDFGGVNVHYIGGVLEDELGTRVREIAEKDHPDIVQLHEGYAVMAFLKLGITSNPEMTKFLKDNSANTTYRDDGIENVPAKAVYYGHWHRSIEPRVVWNENPQTGEVSWTLVSELNTAGGAIGSPTINRFSLPWYPPLQDAEVMVEFMNTESGLATGYQRYTYHPDGTLVTHPRVDVGLPGGVPQVLEQAKNLSLSNDSERPGNVEPLANVRDRN